MTPFFLAIVVCASISPGAAAPRFHREAAPELELAVDLVGLPAVDRDEPDALFLHPEHRVLAARDKDFAQVGIGPVFRHAAHVVEKLVLRVSAEIGIGDLLVGEVRHQRAQVVDAVVDASERAGRKSAVAAGFLLRRTFEHQNGNPMLGGGVCGAERSIAGADDHDVGGAGEFGVRRGIHRRKPDIREGRSVCARFHMSTRRPCKAWRILSHRQMVRETS